MLETLRELTAMSLLCALISLMTAGPAAALGEGPLAHPWWMNAMSFTFSVMAVACAAIAVVELGINPTVFWIAQALTAALLVSGFILAEVGSPVFWIAVVAAILVAGLVVSLVLARVTAKKLTRR